MFTSRQVTVGTTAVDLLSGIDVDRELEVLISAGGVYLGDSGVTTSNGYPFSAGSSSPLRLTLHGDTIYAIASSASVIVQLLVISDK